MTERTLLPALLQESEWISGLFRRDFHVLEPAADGLELLYACQRKPVSVLIADIRLPLLRGMDMLAYLQRERLAECIVLVADRGDVPAGKEAGLGLDGLLIRPLSRAGVYSCVMMAEANVRKNAQIRREYELLDREFRKRRALDHTRQILRRAYGLSEEQADRRLLAITGSDETAAAQLAQRMFEIYLIRNAENETNGGNKQENGPDRGR